jgi:hypothetical protein
MGEAQPAVATAVAAAMVVEAVQRRAPALARQQVTTCGHCSQSMAGLSAHSVTVAAKLSCVLKQRPKNARKRGLENIIKDETPKLHSKPGLIRRLPARRAVLAAPRKRSSRTEFVLPMPQPHWQSNL